MYLHNKTYKKGILAALLSLLGIQATQAQTATQNYVRTRVPNREITTNTKLDALTGNKDSVQTTIQYVDGLGRPLQTVLVKASPTLKDVVQPFVYDQYGREAIKYLPYAASSTADGSYKTDALTAGVGVAQFYNPSGNPATTVTQQTNGIPNTAFPFTQTGFEASPLNRALEQGAPGAAWQLVNTPNGASTNRSVRMISITNDQTVFPTTTGNNGSRRVMIYRVVINSNQTRTLVRGVGATVEYYPSNQLMVTSIRNENWQPSDGCFGTTEEYKDKQGHLIVKRTYNLKSTYSGGVETKTAEMLSTYYVYDDLGNLCFVLPPGASPDVVSVAPDQGVIDYRCYQYRYDARGRLVQKRIPSKGWEYIVYNTLDQPVATQDSVQRIKATQEWTVTKYDALGRAVQTGIYQHSGSTAGVDYHTTIQGLVDVQTAQWETPVNTGHGYTTNCWPGTLATTLSVNYYDSYTAIPNFPSAYDQTANSAFSKQTTGLLTASKTLVLNTTNDYLWSVPYYDNEGKAVKTFSQHYVGGTPALSQYNYDTDSTAYNFLKLPTLVQRKHYLKNAGGIAGVLTLTETNSYNYDHMGRKLSTNHQMRDGSNASQATVTLARSDYNEVGQLKMKRLHSINSGANYLQTIDYRYNPRGWLTNINNANLSNDGGLTSTDANDKFGEELSYDGTASATKQYNGNIATVIWKSAPYMGSTLITPIKQTYDYGYDNLNRLRAAVSSGATKDNLYGENVTYDNMGNITSLGRYDNISGAKTQIDTLAYAYSFYRVDRIDDNAAYTGAFGFQDPIKADHEYTYDGNGNEMRDQNKGISSISYNMLNLPQTIVKSNGNTVVYIYSASGNKLRKLFTAGGITTTTEYDNGIEYDNSTSTVAFIQTEEGRARKSGTNYVYEYDLKDHLGNTRVTITPDPTDGTQQTAKVLQENDYYAFGYGIQSLQLVTPSPKNEYLYNHKELQEETGLYDYGARFYDPVIARWTSVDPLAEISRRFTPYNYGEDNPIRNIDPDGRSTQDWLDANGLTQNNLITVYQAPAQQEDDPKKKKEQPKSKPNQSKPAPRLNPDWFYNIPVVSEASMTNDSFQNGDYWEAGVHQITGILEAFTFAESEAVALWDSFTGLFAKKAVTEGGTSLVYHSVVNGVTQYVGITDNFARREAEHLAQKGINIQPLMQKLARSDARAVEQVLIEIHGLGSKGGTLLNKINSIAKSNPTYGTQLERGYQLLKSIGYH
jgi:RHS repeat-associated protein